MHRARPAIGLALTTLCALALGGAPAAAQETTDCFINQEARPTTRFLGTRDAAGNENLFVGGGAVVRCPGRGITLSSDSAEYYGGQRVWYLIGNVRYREPRLTLDSRRATYWISEERVLAQGDVVATLPSGTTMRGPQLEYFRAVPGVRERERMIAPGRPRFELIERDTTGQPQEPVELVADRVVIDGDSLVYARGQVVVTRPDVVATSDSAVIDSGREWARLIRDPRIESLGDEPFALEGTLIDLYSENRKLRRVLASGEAVIDSEDLDLRSDTIDLRLADEMLQRAYAWGPSGARAVSEQSDISADSLDVLLPDQRLTEVRAIGDAFARSSPDTSRFRTEERDWMSGDSIIAHFDTTTRPGRPARAARVSADTAGARAASTAAAAPDTAAQRDTTVSELRELLAEGNARSYYQLAPEDTSEVRPSVNFVTGRRILVTFREGEVRSVSVAGRTFGVLLQPAVPGTETPATTAPAAGAPASPPPTPASPPPMTRQRP